MICIHIYIYVYDICNIPMLAALNLPLLIVK